MKNFELYALSNSTETFSFNVFNGFSVDSIRSAIKACNKHTKKPIVVCVGSDLVLGDSLGPLIGTMLAQRKVPSFVYGTLNAPVTAKEISCAKTHLKMIHPDGFIIAIDAAVGSREDVGLIKVSDKGLKPGLGVDKRLGVLGDCSVIGIVAEKSLQNYNLFNMTRLNLVYKMAEAISEGVAKYLFDFASENQITA
ncbi:MAG: spore protease YyaC [Clostridia bacterium]|nr:spore protease YyaC [Clostridia bacterium]